LAASDLENLEPGSLIRLGIAANTLPVWKVGGQTLAEAGAIAAGAHRGARMDRMTGESEP
jgi:hypothetical protein